MQDGMIRPGRINRKIKIGDISILISMAGKNALPAARSARPANQQPRKRAVPVKETEIKSGNRKRRGGKGGEEKKEREWRIQKGEEREKTEKKGEGKNEQRATGKSKSKGTTKEQKRAACTFRGQSSRRRDDRRRRGGRASISVRCDDVALRMAAAEPVGERPAAPGGAARPLGVSGSSPNALIAEGVAGRPTSRVKAALSSAACIASSCAASRSRGRRRCGRRRQRPSWRACR